jgi:hypothetical protein
MKLRRKNNIHLTPAEEATGKEFIIFAKIGIHMHVLFYYN